MTAQTPLPVILEPALAEEAVLQAIVGHPDQCRFRRARDSLYLLPDREQRERAFRELHLDWFERLQLGRPIHVACAELPTLAQTCVRFLVSAAPTRSEEGADLLVSSGAEAVERTVVARLRPTTFCAAEELLSLLRAELLHIADMVDPAFGYEPTLPQVNGGPAYERLVRDRYRVLWNTTVIGRLVRRGVASPDAPAEAQRAFAVTFPMLGPAPDAAFERFFSGRTCTHADLMMFAAAPRLGAAGSVPPGLAPGARCPLCRFPTYAPEPTPDRLPRDVIERIVADFPCWRPADGICAQCADLYRVRNVVTAGGAPLFGDSTSATRPG